MIELRNINKVYGEGEARVHALKNINLRIDTNKITAIVGQSGSGKTTLLNLIGSLDSPTSGEIIVNSKDITKSKATELSVFRNQNIGFIFQSYFLEPNLKVIDNVVMPLCIAGVDKKTRETKGLEILKSLGIEMKAQKKAKELSGGEKQRVSIARALISEPKIILADEPTGNLDTKNGNEIIKILIDIAHSGKTVILITHNLKYAEMCDEVITITDGEASQQVNK